MIETHISFCWKSGALKVEPKMWVCQLNEFATKTWTCARLFQEINANKRCLKYRTVSHFLLSPTIYRFSPGWRGIKWTWWHADATSNESVAPFQHHGPLLARRVVQPVLTSNHDNGATGETSVEGKSLSPRIKTQSAGICEVMSAATQSHLTNVVKECLISWHVTSWAGLSSIHSTSSENSSGQGDKALKRLCKTERQKCKVNKLRFLQIVEDGLEKSFPPLLKQKCTC